MTASTKNAIPAKPKPAKKAVAKKPKPGSRAALELALEIMENNKLDFSYIKR